ncbi:MAG TPA: VOC family protein [Terracidiphilus sp.]|nr:VOC family protein [Terracidiphilus sp.]
MGARVGIPFDGLCTLIQVFDMKTSLAFYRDLLGFEVYMTATPAEDGHFDWCWLKGPGNADLMLNTMFEREQRPHRADPARVEAHHDTCFYIGCKDLEAAHKYLHERGVDLHGPTVTHYGAKQIYMKDPDGYSVCLQWSARG